MSRSYKENPIDKISPKHSKVVKNILNRKVRTFKDYIPNGSAYKKLFPSELIINWIDSKTFRKNII
jgi:hypothetical protein